MDLLEKILKVAEAQTERFPHGNDPFRIISRVLEEGGEVAWELNHYERKGVSIERIDPDGKRKLVCETYQVMMVLCQLMQYFDLHDDLKKRVEEVYQEYKDKKYIDDGL